MCNSADVLSRVHVHYLFAPIWSHLRQELGARLSLWFHMRRMSRFSDPFSFFSQGTYWFLSPVCHLFVTLSLHTITVTHQFLKRRSSQHYAALLPWLLNFHKSQWYFCRKLSEGFTPQRQQQTTVYDCSRSLYYAAKCNCNIYNSRMLYNTVIKVYGSYFQCNIRCLINDFQRS